MKTQPLLCLVFGSLFGTVVGGVHEQSREPLAIVDSKGRTRLVTQEAGDEFALILKSPGGEDRLKLATDDAGSEVRITAGSQVLHFRANANGGAGLDAIAGALSLRLGISGDAGGLSVMDGDGKSIVGLAGSKSESALVLKTPATPSDMVTLRAASDGIGRGLILSSSSVAQAGTVITPDGGMVWVGDWLPQTQGRGPGFFVVRDKERGVAVSVRDKEKSPGILLSGEVDVATIQIRSRESGDVAFATKDGVGSAMVIKDASGKEVVRLPAR